MTKANSPQGDVMLNKFIDCFAILTESVHLSYIQMPIEREGISQKRKQQQICENNDQPGEIQQSSHSQKINKNSKSTKYTYLRNFHQKIRMHHKETGDNLLL